MVTLELSVVAVTTVPALPAESEKAIEKATAPSESLACTVIVQVHAFEPVLVTATELVIESPFELNVHVGVWICSDAVEVKVMVSPASASPELELLDDRVTVVRTGWVLSMVTLDASVVAVTAVPALPAESENPIVKLTTPSASLL